MRILKVNHNPTTGKTVVEYDHKENEGHDLVRSRLATKDDPHPTFVNALRALLPDVAGICEVELDDETALVRGLTIKPDDDDPHLSAVTFVATKRVSAANSPLVLNTPAIVPEGDEGARVDAVLDAAREFVLGKRAQAELVSDEEPEADEPSLLDDAGEPEVEEADAEAEEVSI